MARKRFQASRFACVGKTFIELSDTVKKHLHGKSIFDLFTAMVLAHDIMMIIKNTTDRLLPTHGNTKTGINFMEGMRDWTAPGEDELTLLHEKDGIKTEELKLTGKVGKNTQKLLQHYLLANRKNGYR